jgi:hypothetical protein
MPSIRENQEKSNSMAVKHKIYLSALIILMSTAAFGLGRLGSIFAQRQPITVRHGLQDVQSSGAPLGAGVYVGTTTMGIVVPLEPKEAPKAEKPVIAPVIAPRVQSGQYVAARTGKVYYLPWCGVAKRIKEANKVWFLTKADAERAGYTPATNCPGL